jgi:hypothetical protein
MVFDSLTKATAALTSAATINSGAINLGAAATNQVGGPVVGNLVCQVHYPSNPTGTSPTVTPTLEYTKDAGSTWHSLGKIHATDSATTGFPKVYEYRFVPPVNAQQVRVSFVVGGTTPNYGTATVKVTNAVGERRV